VGYYGGGVTAMSDKTPQIPVMLHFGETDHSISMADVEKVKVNQPGVPVHVYPAGHGFNCDERASFHAASADLARQRTLAFFARHLA
jgi:carboxymethylenebutenolidase